MAEAPDFENLYGEWTGTNSLWLEPGIRARESCSTARVSAYARGQFVALAYTWAFEGKPQEGLILFPSAIAAGASQAVWIDSWHMRDAVMICEASMREGVVALEGSYAAPPGPDWGWRIEIEAEEARSLRMRMFNITPQGEEEPAVSATYERD